MSLNGYAAVRMCLMSDSALLSVWLTPRAARDEVVGWQAGGVRPRPRAPPRRGQGEGGGGGVRRRGPPRRPASAIGLAPGPPSPQKRLRIAGLSGPELRERLTQIGLAEAGDA